MGLGWIGDRRDGGRKRRRRRSAATSTADASTSAPQTSAVGSSEPAKGSDSKGSLPAGQAGASDVFAAIDLGTNNCRMLIAKPERGGGFRVIDSFSRITRLGEGLTSTGRLSRVAQDRTIEALKRCADKMLRRGVTESRKVATEACRRADNGAEFLHRVRAETGMTLECISADEEARLALTGCASLLTRERPYALVFDIGGGSTELVWVKLTDSPYPCVEGFATLPLGVVTVAEDCGGGDLCNRTYDAVVERVRALLLPFELRHRISAHVQRDDVQMLGTSGTVTTLGGLYLGLNRYDRALVDGITMGFDDITLLSRRLAGMSHRQRAESPCIGPQRADLVLAGCAILEAICSLWPMGRLTVADRGLREGMLMDLMAPSPALLDPDARAALAKGGFSGPGLVSVPPRRGPANRKVPV